MTYKELYEKAEEKLEKGEITCGEFDELTKPLDEEIRPHGEWKETGYYTYCSICGNGARWLYNFCPNCGTKMVKRGLRAKMGFVDDAADGKIDLEYLKVGNTIYTQDSDKQGWTGREENK